MRSQRDKIKKLNNTLILLYFLSSIFAVLKIEFPGKILLGFVVIVFTLFLLLVNIKDLKYKNSYMVPLYYYFFVLIILVTVYFSGSYNSVIYPAIFLIPFVHAVVNFSRREATAIVIFILAIMWLILLEDIYLNKIFQVMFVSIYIVSFQLLFGIFKKDYKFCKEKPVLISHNCNEDDKE